MSLKSLQVPLRTEKTSASALSLNLRRGRRQEEVFPPNWLVEKCDSEISDSATDWGALLNDGTHRQGSAALKSELTRIIQATSKVAAFARTHPNQAFHLLRATAAACKAEYLIQTITRISLIDQLVATCSTEMRHAYNAIIRGVVDDFVWAHATLPQREGLWPARPQNNC